MTWRVVAVVTALWTLVGVVSGAQGSLAAALQGAPAQPLGPAIVDALNQFLPWIPHPSATNGSRDHDPQGNVQSGPSP